MSYRAMIISLKHSDSLPTIIYCRGTQCWFCANMQMLWNFFDSSLTFWVKSIFLSKLGTYITHSATQQFRWRSVSCYQLWMQPLACRRDELWAFQSSDPTNRGSGDIIFIMPWLPLENLAHQKSHKSPFCTKYCRYRNVVLGTVQFQNSS